MTLRSTIKRTVLAPVAVFRSGRPGRRIALTFDDGPDPRHTPLVSAALREGGARGTFFLVGERIQRFADVARELADDGHELACHSMTHPEAPTVSYAAFEREVQDVFRLTFADGSPVIRNRFFRPPKGVVTIPMLLFCLLRRIRLVFWSHDPEDFMAQSPDDILGYFDRNSLEPGDIVLLHDKTPHIVAALPALLDRLAHRQLRPVTVSDLLAQ
jgi:peptidoglycan/xylan/chitin deacetylase (PgdA/CDA1 family)